MCLWGMSLLFLMVHVYDYHFKIFSLFEPGVNVPVTLIKAKLAKYLW